MMRKLEARLEASEQRWSISQRSPRPEPDSPYGMPFSWQSSSWAPSGISMSAIAVTVPPISQPATLPYQMPPNTNPPLGFRPSGPAIRSPPVLQPSSWDLPPPLTHGHDATGQRSTWDVAGARFNGPSQSPPDLSRHIKMDPPLFDGTDAQSWVTRIQYYFDHIMLPEEQRLHYVMMLFVPPAANWIFSYRTNIALVSWQRFLDDVRHRFDPSLLC